MAVQLGIVGIEISLPLPAECSVDTVYRVEGKAKLLRAIPAAPWIYLEVNRKAWYEPEHIEKWFTSYEQGLPMPSTGNFTIDWRPEREGEYEVRAIATPAPIDLPVLGVGPLTGASEVMNVIVTAAAPPTPPTPPIPPIPPEVSIGDIIRSQLAFDIRSYLIMLYRLGRAREVRLFSYLEVDAAGTATYTYTVPKEYIYIPHIEEVTLGLQREITRYDYEGGNLLFTETYATDRTVEWTMTPLSRVIEGSFAVSFNNEGATDTWIKSRFLGSLMRQSDFLTWRRLVRGLSGKYLGFTA